MVAHRDLDDIDRAFSWLADSIIAHVDEASLDALAQLGSDVGDMARVESVLSRALDVFALVDADEAYVLVALAGLLPREEHNELLETALPMIRERDRRPQDRIRVVFEGGFCEQPPLDMVRMIGRSCYLVDDDLLIGLRWILEDVPADGDPLQNLAESYLERSSYSPVQHDLRKPKEKMLLERIAGARAEAAIVTAAKMCEPGLEEQVAYTRALDETDIPYFVSEFQENMTSLDQLEIQLETFVENLLFA